MVASNKQEHLSVVDFIHGLEPSIAEQLGTDMEDARDFVKPVIYAIECSPRLLSTTRESLAAAILTAAKMRLVPSLGLGRLAVQYVDGRSEALFTPAWRGFVQILHDHAGLLDATCEVLYDRDFFQFKRGKDDRDEVSFSPCSFGPRGSIQGAFVRLILESKSGQKLQHVEVLWREGDIEPVTPDGSDAPETARGSSRHDYVEWIKTVALKRAAKWCASRTRKGAALIAAAIELERGIELSRQIPSAEKVARMLGIEIPNKGGIWAPDPKAADPRGDIPPDNRSIALPPSPPTSAASPSPRCCSCGLDDQGELIAYAILPKIWRGCQGCGALGIHHKLCLSCVTSHNRARKEVEEAEAKDDARRRAMASNARASGVVGDRLKGKRSKANGNGEPSSEAPPKAAPSDSVRKEGVSTSREHESTESAGVHSQAVGLQEASAPDSPVTAGPPLLKSPETPKNEQEAGPAVSSLMDPTPTDVRVEFPSDWATK